MDPEAALARLKASLKSSSCSRLASSEKLKDHLGPFYVNFHDPALYFSYSSFACLITS